MLCYYRFFGSSLDPDFDSWDVVEDALLPDAVLDAAKAEAVDAAPNAAALCAGRISVMHMRFLRRFPAAPRDAVFATSTYSLDGGALAVVAVSVDHPSCPPGDAIRGA